MRYRWDPAKSERNRAERDLPVDAVARFDWASAVIIEDIRRDYGERRMFAVGKIGDRVHVAIFTDCGDVRWIISLRKAKTRGGAV